MNNCKILDSFKIKESHRKYFVLFAFMSTILSTNVHAGSFLCAGHIDMLFVNRSGGIEVYSNEIFSDGAGRVICNVNGTSAVTQSTCKLWYTEALTGYTLNRQIGIYYLTEETTSCATVPPYSTTILPWGVKPYNG